jgi:hypothetical protein
MNATHTPGWPQYVMHVDDERDIGNGVIVMLADGYEFVADPGCGTRGFDTMTEAKRGVTKPRIRRAKVSA